MERGRIVWSLVLSFAACSGGSGDPGGAATPTVPDGASVITTEERDGARFEVFSAAGCDYLKVTNLADGAFTVDELCAPFAATVSDACLLRAERVDAPDGVDQEAPPCLSEVPWTAVWGRASYDFIAVACQFSDVNEDATTVLTGPDGEYLMLVPPGPTDEPGFLLSDGRAVQGDVWPVPLDDDGARRCRDAAGLTEPAHHLTFGTISIENSELLTDGSDIVELSTDTGWVWLADAGLAGGSVDRVAVFDDTRRLMLRGLEDDYTAVSEFVVELDEELSGLIESSSCFRLVIDLVDHGSADARADAC